MQHLRLSDAIEQLRSAGLSYTDQLQALGSAALHNQIVATGFNYVITPEGRASSAERQKITSRIWRVFSSDKAALEGFRCFAIDESLHWKRAENGERMQESWTCVLFDRPSFELWIADVASHAAANRLQEHEINNWIRTYHGRNGAKAWDAFRNQFGQRAGKRTSFRTLWQRQKRRARGRPPGHLP